MSSSYSGDATGLTERTDAVSITVPADTDPLNVASIIPAIKKHADFLKLHQETAGFISLANTWAQLQTFGIAPAFPTETVYQVGVGPAPSFVATWSSGTDSARFWKDALGYVHMEGIASKSSPYAASTVFTIFTLPAGYRPLTKVERYFTIYATSSVIHVAVNTDGTVTVDTTASGLNDAYFGGIVFSTLH